MSRQFTHQIPEEIRLAPGSALVNFDGGPSTFIYLWRPTGVVRGGLLAARIAGGGSTSWSTNPFDDFGTSGRIYHSIGGFVSTGATAYTATDGWRLDVFSNPGAGIPIEWSRYFFDNPGAGWTLQLLGSLTDTTNLPVNFILLGAFNGIETLHGRLGAISILGQSLTPTQVATSGLESALSVWMGFTPLGAWKFNVDDVASGAVDLTGNGANETAHTGTTFSTDEPAGFNYSLGGPPAEGSAAFDLGLALAGVGGRSSEGIAAVNLNLALAAASRSAPDVVPLAIYRRREQILAARAGTLVYRRN